MYRTFGLLSFEHSPHQFLQLGFLVASEEKVELVAHTESISSEILRRLPVRHLKPTPRRHALRGITSDFCALTPPDLGCRAS